MKKIGILTLLYNNYNYGGALQAYALTKYLYLNGYDAEGILYSGSDNIVYPSTRDKFKQYSKIEIGKKVYQKIESKINNKRIEKLLSNRRNRFLEFQEKYIPTSPVFNDNDLKRIENKYDFFISGSDQVWNPNCAFSLFLQKFVQNSEKKISYAASISRNSLSEHEAEIMIPYIAKFKNCSVREKTAKKILEDQGISNVKVVLDPTFLLSKEQWMDIIPKNQKKEKYALAYFFSDSKQYRKKIQIFCKKNNLKLYYIPYSKQEYISTDSIGDGVPQENVGPIEFLKLLNNAEYVFTDSFHGVALSINLEKQFVVFERDSKKSGASMNSRIYDILELFKIRDRLISNIDKLDQILSEKINYSVVSNILKEERIKSEEFLKSALLCDQKKNTNEKNKEIVDFYMPRKFYAAASKANIKRSSSGGIFPLLAKRILKYNNGVIYGVSFDKSFNVIYKRIEKENDLYQIIGSKYVQSNFSKYASFETVENDLRNGKIVLFSGVGCQIMALRYYLQKHKCSEENLITVEVICHGTPSIETWKSYREYMTKKYKSKLADVNFRDKKYGWNAYSIYMKFENGSKYRKIMNEDPYMQVYLSGYSVVDGCLKCKNKRNKRVADITLGDLWGISLPEFSDIIKNGISLVVINTDKGNKLLGDVEEKTRIKELTYEQKNIALSNMMGFPSYISKKNKKKFKHSMNINGFYSTYRIWKKDNKKYYLINEVKAKIKLLRFRSKK